MSNTKKTITVSGIMLNNFVSLTLIILSFFAWQPVSWMPGDFPEGSNI